MAKRLLIDFYEDLGRVQGQSFLSSCHTTLLTSPGGFRPCHTSPREGESNWTDVDPRRVSTHFSILRAREKSAFPTRHKRVATRVGDARRAGQSEFSARRSFPFGT